MTQSSLSSASPRATLPEPPAPRMAPAVLVEASGLIRRYGQSYALRGVDFTLHAGECVALLGPNGAGKTTLIRVLATALRPAAGALTIAGLDATRDPGLARCQIGLVGHQTFLYGDLTVRENLRLYGRLFGVEPLEARISSVLDRVELTPRADSLVRVLSRGLQQRAAVARAILHSPRVLLLDEPETGLDDAAQHRLGDLLGDWTSTGGAAIIASHRLDWVQDLADRAVVLDQGKVVDTLDLATAAPGTLASAYRLTLATEERPPTLTLPRQGGGNDSPLPHQGSENGTPLPQNEWNGTTLGHQREEHNFPNPHPGAGGQLVPPLRGEVGRAAGPHQRGSSQQALLSPSSSRAPHPFQQICAVLAKDLRLEWRTKEALTAMLVFSFLVLVTFNFALDLRPEVMAAVGPGVLWVAIVFASTLGLGRTFAVERDQATLEGLLIAPLDRSALFFAKLLGNLLFMLALELVSLPAFVALFNVTVDLLPVIAILTLGTVGLAAVGTLFSAIAAHTRAREVMLPVLLFPVIVPILIGVVQATGPALGSSTSRDMPWISLLAAFAAIFVAAGAVVFEYVLEE